jgi:hypothetical protein
MANKSGNAYALTLLCPILPGVPAQVQKGLEEQSHASLLRYELQQLRVSAESPMARVPNTYLSRLFVLQDVPYQGKPAYIEHLKSSYLVFSSNFYGDLDTYLTGMWGAVREEIRAVLQYCVGFDKVTDVQSYIRYIKACQVETTFFFNGSTDEPLAEQLKGLYLKQEFSKFAFSMQGAGAGEMQAAFRDFLQRTQPADLSSPTWRAGVYHLEEAIFDSRMTALPGEQSK